MSKINRRDFLKSGIAVGSSAALGMPSIALANGWGDIPTGVWPSGFEGYKVLEIFCYSGMSQWENFWVSETSGGGKDWRAFSTQVAGIDWGCQASPSPAVETTYFANDDGGNPIHWGPATKPLWRSDIFDRARMVTVGHDLLPHQAASPLAMTGRRLGNPRMAGLGAAIQHRANSLAPRDLPYSYVVSHDNLGFFDFIEAPMIATGLHPGSSQPFLLRTGNADLQTLLSRNDSSPELDQLSQLYNAQYRDRLRWQGVGDPVRSKGYSSYDSSLSALMNSQNMVNLLGGNVLDINNSPVCARYSTGITGAGNQTASTPLSNRTGTALNLAVKTLTEGDGRYACAVDRGLLEAAAGAPYDTHTNTRHAETNATNLFNLTTELASHIDPTGNDPTKLNLDNTIIVINTEFGRGTGYEFSGSSTLSAGRRHHPYGYVSVLIGGPIQSRGIAGTLNSSGNVVTGSDYSPTDVHGAVMLAAGVDPFAGENFGVSDFTSNVHDGTEQGTRLGLKQQILGA